MAWLWIIFAGLSEMLGVAPPHLGGMDRYGPGL